MPTVIPPYDIAVFWKQNDSGLYGRRHEMLVENLARSPRVGRVIQFDYPMSAEALREHARVGGGEKAHQSELIAGLTRRRTAGLRLRENAFAYTFLYEGAASGDGDDAPAAEAFTDYVGTVLAHHGIEAQRSVFWVYPRNFYFRALCAALVPALCVADIVDDERNWVDPGSHIHGRLTSNYEEVLGRAEILLTNCAPLRSRMANLAAGKSMTVIPNACEEPFRRSPSARPAELRSLRGPTVGYAGNLSSRLDIGLVDNLADSRPEWQLVLLGSAHLDRAALRLDRYPNVHFLGVRPYREAKRLLRAFDVGLIPHVRSEMTEVMNPLKAFVYCANDVPIVATPIANVDELRDVIDVADGPDDFLAKVQHALERGRDPDLTAARRRVATRHTWRARVDRILGLLDEASAGRPVSLSPVAPEHALRSRR